MKGKGKGKNEIKRKEEGSVRKEGRRQVESGEGEGKRNGEGGEAFKLKNGRVGREIKSVTVFVHPCLSSGLLRDNAHRESQENFSSLIM